MAESQSWALLVVDHGSREPEANAVVERLSGALARRLQGEPCPPRSVRYAHMELCEPDLAAAIEQCARDGVEQLVVVPFFLAPGRHARSDIPGLVQRACERHPGLKIQLADVLGDDPLLVELLARRALGVLGLER